MSGMSVNSFEGMWLYTHPKRLKMPYVVADSQMSNSQVSVSTQTRRNKTGFERKLDKEILKAFLKNYESSLRQTKQLLLEKKKLNR